ncbi:hypothetical protein F5X68DRAFT_260045 [Plectosphaerella plurivora]|uniref:Uncharacterized protein n=1 Tax=Plectosphaerella plurivora TaxID=936078 RepID=A0A9P8VH15_9PEZI|nr:hypothetical protein F5X68DRAFT_260045 [Plectosphaerella plurivora]
MDHDDSEAPSCPTGYIEVAGYQKSISDAVYRVLVCCAAGYRYDATLNRLRETGSLMCTLDAPKLGQDTTSLVVPALVVKGIMPDGGPVGRPTWDTDTTHASDSQGDAQVLLLPRQYVYEEPLFARDAGGTQIAIIFGAMSVLIVLVAVALCFCWPACLRSKSTTVRRPNRRRVLGQQQQQQQQQQQYYNGGELGYVPCQQAYGIPQPPPPCARYA